jgi:hydroxyethylthiazole kinase-like sugar kinase family protein
MGPGTLRVALIDHLHLMDEETIKALARIEAVA